MKFLIEKFHFFSVFCNLFSMCKMLDTALYSIRNVSVYNQLFYKFLEPKLRLFLLAINTNLCCRGTMNGSCISTTSQIIIYNCVNGTCVPIL